MFHTLAKELRKRPTEAERLLWRHLRAHRFSAMKFRRQQPLGKYIVDFICFEKEVIIELDGGGHAIAQSQTRDTERDAWLLGQEFRVLRFWNNDVLGNLPNVMQIIWVACTDDVDD